MNIFLISPVRNILSEYQEEIETQVKYLEEQGNKVYWPLRDTSQNASELEICKTNLFAMQNSDIVYIIWDGNSQGVLFDLGMAFVLRKPIRTIIGYMPVVTTKKSFQNMIYEWEEKL